MNEPEQPATAPTKPTLVWDGDCGFCRFWVIRWQSWTGDKVDYVSYQEARRTELFPRLAVEDCEKAVQYVDTDGRIYQAAEAVFRSLTQTRWLSWLLWFYLNVPLVARITEPAYRFVAGNRKVFSLLNRLLWGRNSEIPTYQRTSHLFIRGIGFVFLIAFLSLWTQVHGLMGEQGILPASGFMHAVDGYFDQNDTGLSRYAKFPTLGWLAAGDTALTIYCLAGVVCSALVVTGFVPALALFGCWTLYLSLTALGQDFLGFQWEALILETGFLAILVAPWSRTLKTAAGKRRFFGIFLVRWLLFRLMLESGLVKLASGDPVWQNLTALNFHFETQPLPTWIGWFAHQLPESMLKTATLGMFAIELFVPLFIFAPRRLRIIAFFPLVGLQISILLTGNYGFFNLLTLVLCLALLDDRAIGNTKEFFIRCCKKLSGRPQKMDKTPSPCPETINVLPPNPGPRIRSRRQTLHTSCLTAYAVLAISIGGLHIVASAGARTVGPGPIGWASGQLAPFRLINNYGLFAVMTRLRPELVIEGSIDGVNWLPYVFKYKPGPFDQRPAFLPPFHMPRLDWQMWFAALSEGRPPNWLHRFCERLFERSPEVIALLENDPFADEAPKYLRVHAYDYEFTEWNDDSDDWWQAGNKRYYMPILQYERQDQQ